MGSKGLAMEARKVLLLAWRAREFLALLSEDMLAFPPGGRKVAPGGLRRRKMRRRRGKQCKQLSIGLSAHAAWTLQSCTVAHCM